MMESNECRDRRKSSVMFSDIFKVHEDDEESFEDVGVDLYRPSHPLPTSSRPSFLSTFSGHSDSSYRSFYLVGLAFIIFLIGVLFGVIVMRMNGCFAVTDD